MRPYELKLSTINDALVHPLYNIFHMASDCDSNGHNCGGLSIGAQLGIGVGIGGAALIVIILFLIKYCCCKSRDTHRYHKVTSRSIRSCFRSRPASSRWDFRTTVGSAGSIQRVGFRSATAESCVLRSRLSIR